MKINIIYENDIIKNLILDTLENLKENPIRDVRFDINLDNNNNYLQYLYLLHFNNNLEFKIKEVNSYVKEKEYLQNENVLLLIDVDVSDIIKKYLNDWYSFHTKKDHPVLSKNNKFLLYIKWVNKAEINYDSIIGIPIIHKGTRSFLLTRVNYHNPLSKNSFKDLLISYFNIIGISNCHENVIFGSMSLELYGLINTNVRPRDLDFWKKCYFGKHNNLDSYKFNIGGSLKSNNEEVSMIERMFGNFSSMANASKNVTYSYNNDFNMKMQENNDLAGYTENILDKKDVSKINSLYKIYTIDDMIYQDYNVFAYGVFFLNFNLEIFRKHLRSLDDSNKFEKVNIRKKDILDFNYIQNEIINGKVIDLNFIENGKMNIQKYLSYLALDKEIDKPVHNFILDTSKYTKFNNSQIISHPSDKARTKLKKFTMKAFAKEKKIDETKIYRITTKYTKNQNNIPYSSYSRINDGLKSSNLMNQKIFRDVEILSLPITPVIIKSIHRKELLYSVWLWILSSNGKFDVLFVSNGMEFGSKHMVLANGVKNIVAAGELYIDQDQNIFINDKSGTYIPEIKLNENDFRYKNSIMNYLLLNIKSSDKNFNKKISYVSNEFIDFGLPHINDIGYICSNKDTKNKIFLFPNVPIKTNPFVNDEEYYNFANQYSNNSICYGSNYNDNANQNNIFNINDNLLRNSKNFNTVNWKFYQKCDENVLESSNAYVLNFYNFLYKTKELLKLDLNNNIYLNPDKNRSYSNTHIILTRYEIKKKEIQNNYYLYQKYKNIVNNYVSVKIGNSKDKNLSLEADFYKKINILNYNRNIVNTSIMYSEILANKNGINSITYKDVINSISELLTKKTKVNNKISILNDLLNFDELKIIISSWNMGKEIHEFDFDRDESIDDNEINSIYLQILWTLYIFQLEGLKHNDLHTKNIFITKISEPIDMVFCLPVNGLLSYFSIRSNYSIKIFDFDRSRENYLKTDKNNFTMDFYNFFHRIFYQSYKWRIFLSKIFNIKNMNSNIFIEINDGIKKLKNTQNALEDYFYNFNNNYQSRIYSSEEIFLHYINNNIKTYPLSELPQNLFPKNVDDLIYFGKRGEPTGNSTILISTERYDEIKNQLNFLINNI